MNSVGQQKLRMDRTMLTGLGVVLLLFAASLIIASSFPGIRQAVRKVELGLLDQRMRFFQPVFSAASSPIVVVDIDDDSDDELHAVWPWPRSYYARLIRNLYRAGARQLVIDVEFLKERPDAPEGDDTLALALREFPDVILGGKIQYESWEMRSGVKVFDHSQAKISVYPPYERFLNADSSNWGLTNVETDPDGIVRNYFTKMQTAEGGALYPTLAVKAFEQLTGETYHPARRTFRIAYPGPAKSFPYYSFSQVVDDSSFWTRGEEEWGEETNWFDSLHQAGVFRDRIVFVGATMKELHDFKLTPFSSYGHAVIEVPGVEVHAAALHTLLNGFVIRDARPGAVLAALLTVCLLLYVISLIAPTAGYTAAVLTAAGLWTATAWWVYGTRLISIPVAVPMLVFVVVTAGYQGYLFYREQARRRQVVGMFGKFVPPGVVHELIRDPSRAKLSGERRELTVLFTDVEGFTSIAEAMEPEQVAALLNEYLTPMSEIIRAQGGIIDKFEGDLIMAEFGIPLAMPDHALRACQTAFLMQKRLHELNEAWRGRGKPLLRARTGIGSGMMVFGNMGSEQVFDYTVLGDVVNLASRLEGVNKTYGTWIMVNERSAELVRDRMLVREMDLLLVTGKHIPEKCFQLLAPVDSPKADEIRRVSALFTQGLLAYREQRWDEAETHFTHALGIWPDDTPSKVFIERCRVFRDNPPGETWDGVFEMKTK